MRNKKDVRKIFDEMNDKEKILRRARAMNDRDFINEIKKREVQQ